jgi:hydrogenase maturation protease
MTESSDDARVEKPGIVKIIGIGQSLRGDDAAGLKAVNLWHENYQAKLNRPSVKVVQANIPGLGLLGLLESSRAAILVDAVHSGAEPGTIHQVIEAQLSSFGGGSGTAHGWGVAETLALGRQLKLSAMPARLILIGIEVGQLDLGESLSPEVESALPEAARVIEQAVQDELAHF